MMGSHTSVQNTFNLMWLSKHLWDILLGLGGVFIVKVVESHLSESHLSESHIST